MRRIACHSALVIAFAALGACAAGNEDVGVVHDSGAKDAHTDVSESGTSDDSAAEEGSDVGADEDSDVEAGGDSDGASDSGSVGSDSGSVGSDSGSVGSDSGSMGSDSGSTGSDSGSMGSDSGSDVGAGSDTGITGKIIFVSSQVYTGNLGGVSGADDKCNALAAGKLPGTYKAWLSGSTAATSASSRLSHSTGPYVLVDGTLVADDWAALTSTTSSSTINPLKHAINLTENGDPAPLSTHACGGSTHMVWTNTSNSGTTWAGSACSNWSSTTGSSGPSIGASEFVTQTWTLLCSQPSGCSLTAALYCVQQ